MQVAALLDQWQLYTALACKRRLQRQRSVCRARMERAGCGARPVFGGCRGHAAWGRACCDGRQAEAGAAEAVMMTWKLVTETLKVVALFGKLLMTMDVI